MRGAARALAAALAAGALAASPAGALEVEGTWYVLVHYQDPDSNKPEAWRWEDRVWKFERAGDRLEWTEYPIVVLEDESGRFENLGTNRQARIVAAWEPTPEQLSDIQNGVQVHSRGVKVKALRATDGAGAWASSESAAVESASIITYTEHWSIEGLADLPVFSREDSMGSARSETFEGLTEYRTAEVRDGGRELVGSYERDGTRKGRFRMIRSGDTEKVRGSGKTQGERLQRMFAQQVGLTLSEAQLESLRTGKLQPGTEVPEDMREELRAEIRRSVEDAFRQQDQDPRRFGAQIESLTAKIERLLVEDGKSLEEVQRMLAAGEILP